MAARPKDCDRAVGSRFDGAPDLEFRLATEALELEQFGLSYQRVPPAIAFRTATRTGGRKRCTWFGGGSGRMKLDDEIVELKQWTRCASQARLVG